MTKRLTNVFKILSSIFYLLHDKIKLKKCALENLEIEIAVIPQNFQSLNINFILRIIPNLYNFLKKEKKIISKHIFLYHSLFDIYM